MTPEIDIVVTWVDGGDPAWLQERSHYLPSTGTDCADCRYRDWGLLRYWFRGIEQFAPWARRVHFITWGHLPPWLNTEAPRLHIVRHQDYIPAEFLPTYNSCALELHLHRIEGLAERFIYFNDDIFPLRPLKPELFFRNGKPCDLLAFQPVVANPTNPVMSHSYLNDALVLCKYFDKRQSVRQHPGNYFHLGYPPLYFFYNLLEMSFPKYTGFYTVHSTCSFLKTTFQELWEREEPILNETSRHRFRDERDVTIRLFRNWQMLRGNFFPRNIQRDLSYYEIRPDNSRLLSAIRKQKSRIFCINDTLTSGDVPKIRRELQTAFQQILPKPSSFER